MKREYFLTTERLGFSWWTGEDLELANGLWEDPQVCRYICAAGQFSDDEVRKEAGPGDGKWAASSCPVLAGL